MSTAVLTTAYLQFGSDKDYVFCVESEFFMHDVSEKLRGFFLLLLLVQAVLLVQRLRLLRLLRPGPYPRRRCRRQKGQQGKKSEHDPDAGAPPTPGSRPGRESLWRALRDHLIL